MHDHGSESCREIFARLSEYLDDELSAALCREMEGHLDGCEPCKVFLESLRRTVRLVEGVEATPLPQTIRQEVREAYDRLQRERGG